MPEAVKEVVTEVPQAAFKKENSPDKLPCKEVKPAEASSGTLPADEKPSVDTGEGAVAPDLGQGEAPEQGKSETSEGSSDILMEEGKEDPEKEVAEAKNNSSDKKEPVSDSVNSELKPDNSTVKGDESENLRKEEHLAEESKETASDESLSQESKQQSPEECQIDESKQASPEQSKTEESMETEPSNDQDSKTIQQNQEEKVNSKLMEENKGKKVLDAKTDKDNIKQDNVCSKEKQANEKDTVTEETVKREETKEVVHDASDKQKSNAEKEEPMEEVQGPPVLEQEKKEISHISKEEKQFTVTPIASNETAQQESDCHTKNIPSGDKMEDVSKEGQERPDEKNTEVSVRKEKQLNETSLSENKEELKESVNPEGKSKEVISTESSSSVDGQNTPVEKSAKEVLPEKQGEMEVGNESDINATDKSDSGKGSEDADGSGCSKEIDANSAEEVKQQIREGKGLLMTGDYFTAADILGKACETAGKLYGDLANDNAELYYLYGCAMLECAKNENNVLGEGVKEKDEEENSEEGTQTQDDEVNGEEQMETEENEDGEEEKMAVDGDETGNNKVGKEEKSDSELLSTENGLEGETKKNGSTKENSDEEEDSSLKVAWEMFELAKITFTRMGNDKRLADTYIKLGEVGIESGHQTALNDMKAALELRKICCTDNLRLISETHFNLGLGFATFEMFDEAIEQFKISKSLLEEKVDSLLKMEEQKAQDEIKDIKELLPDLDDKIQDMRDSKETKFKQTPNGEKPSLDSGESSKPVSNISHLVKRKRKLEDVASDLLPNSKQPCTENIPDTEQSEK